MSVTELQRLSKIIRNGWKELANEESNEYDNAVEVAKSILDELEKFESSVEAESDKK